MLKQCCTDTHALRFRIDVQAIGGGVAPLVQEIRSVLDGLPETEGTLGAVTDVLSLVERLASASLEADIRAAIERLSDELDAGEGSRIDAVLKLVESILSSSELSDVSALFLELQRAFGGASIETGLDLSEAAPALRGALHAPADPVGQRELGDLYSGLRPRGASADLAQALNWYRRAAERGDLDAQFRLGALHQHGRGVPASHAEALSWYRLAALAGHPRAQNGLATLYAEGLGVAVDNVEAYAWARLADHLPSGSHRAPALSGFPSSSGSTTNARPSMW